MAMAIKNWKKIRNTKQLTQYRKGDITVSVLHHVMWYPTKIKVIVSSKKTYTEIINKGFPTLSTALAYAKAYMRKH